MTDTAPSDVSPEAPSGRSLGRQIAAGLIIAAGSLLIILSVLAIWIHTVVYDTPPGARPARRSSRTPGSKRMSRST